MASDATRKARQRQREAAGLHLVQISGLPRVTVKTETARKLAEIAQREQVKEENDE